MNSLTTDDEIVAATRAWIERAVIGLNLCPFAKAVYAKERIRYVVSAAGTPGELLADFVSEMNLLADAPPDVETTLLIHPRVLADFLDYNYFLGLADRTLEGEGHAGVLQVASFHPQYQFADAEAGDITNYTNRSPYPMLHLLREDSVSRAVAAFPDAGEIYGKNIETLNRLGVAGWAELMSTPPPTCKH